jgi:hypothetical protein
MVALGILLGLAPALKANEVWRWRMNLQGLQVEIYDVMKGDQKVGTGLRQIVEIPKNGGKPKYRDMIKPEWESVFVVQKKAVFARKLKDHGGTLFAIPIAVKDGKFKVEKPVPTPYRALYNKFMSYETGNMSAKNKDDMDVPGMLMGLRKQLNVDRNYSDEMRIQLQLSYQSSSISDWDVLDDDFRVKFTVNNVRGYPRRYGTAWMIQFDSNEVSPLTVFLNEDGEPVSPEIPLIKEFNLAGPSVYAIPTTLDFERFIPILADGRIRPEPIPTAGYYPGLAFHDKKGYRHTTVQHWIKEYTTPEGPRFGWASLDLAQESGPLWRSIRHWNHPFNPVYQGSAILAQMSDGSWMIYDVTPASGSGIPHRPFLSHTYPTRDAAIEAFAPIYKREVAEPALARRREELKQYAVQAAEMTKYLGIDPAMSSGGVPESQFRSELYRTVTMLNSRLYKDFDDAWPKLPGDYRLKYMAIAYQLRRVGMSEESAKQYAASAVNPSIKATFESIARSIKQSAEDEAKRKRETEEARKREMSDPNRFAARPPAASAGWTSSGSSSSTQPSFAESSRRHEQYMGQMWKYLGGQQAWRPYK